MNDKKIIERQIVLGAGASAGYPMGSELLEMLKINDNDVKSKFKFIVFIEFLNYLYYKKSSGFLMISRYYENYNVEYNKLNNHPRYQNKNDSYYDDLKKIISEIIIFSNNLKKSSATSIDYFVSRITNQDQQALVKALIGSIINSYQTNIEETWYGNLLPLYFPDYVETNSLRETIQKTIEEITKLCEKIRILTFNYDLSLEKFLYEFLKNNVFPFEQKNIDQETKDLYRKAVDDSKIIIFQTITHIYGSIDDPMKCNFDEIENENNRKEFSKILLNAFDDFDKFKKDGKNENTKFIKNIKLIGEERNNVDVKLHQCDNLYILGFGFDPINIEKIGLKSGIWNNACYITNFSDNQRIKRIALNKLTRMSSIITFPIISSRSIKDALINDFSLNEILTPTEANFGGRNLDSSESPYFAMKKYEQNIIINNNSKE
jgi:hypothetical protein